MTHGRIVNGQFHVTPKVEEPLPPEPGESARRPSHHNGRRDQIVALLSREPGLKIAEIHERVGLGGHVKSTSSTLTLLKRAGRLRNKNGRWFVGAVPPSTAGPTGLSRVLALLQQHPGGASLDQLHPPKLTRETVATYLHTLCVQGKAHHNGLTGAQRRWSPGPTPTSAPEVAPAPAPPAAAAPPEPPVPAALVHRLADGQGAPPGTATERLYWLLGRMER